MLSYVCAHRGLRAPRPSPPPPPPSLALADRTQRSPRARTPPTHALPPLNPSSMHCLPRGHARPTARPRAVRQSAIERLFLATSPRPRPRQHRPALARPYAAGHPCATCPRTGTEYCMRRSPTQHSGRRRAAPRDKRSRTRPGANDCRKHPDSHACDRLTQPDSYASVRSRLCVRRRGRTLSVRRQQIDTTHVAADRVPRAP